MTHEQPSDHSKHRRTEEGAIDAEELGWPKVVPIDIKKISSFSEMASAMGETGFDGQHVGKAVDVLTEMALDKNSFNMMTVSGAMVPAGYDLLICNAIESGQVQGLTITGAQVAHGFVRSVGLHHYKVPKDIDDAQLYEMGQDRIYTTTEQEKHLDEVERIFGNVLKRMDDTKVHSSRSFTHAIGKYLSENEPGPGILKSAYEMGVPVFIPAFTDCELGLDIGIHNKLRVMDGKPPLKYNDFIDLDFYAELIRAQSGKKLGIYTIGGGVPRNWTQQVGPYLDIQAKRLGFEAEEPAMFWYATRICPEPANWGGLSGCTYEEGKSWGKFWPDCKYAEVLVDATIIWPYIAKGVAERIAGKKIVKNVFCGKDAILETEKKVEMYQAA